jgi:hypothetical protein
MADFRLGRLKFNWRGDWTPSTAYVIDDIAKFGANTYVCTTNHTSSASEQSWYSVDQTNWSLHTEGVRNVGAFVPGTFYKINDVILDGNTQRRVTAGIGTIATGIGSTNTTLYVGGFKGEGSWDAGTIYDAGDVVLFNGVSYVAITTSTQNVIPSTRLGTQWNVLADGISAAGITTYDNTTNYFRGQLVRLGGNTYKLSATSTTGVNPAVGSTAGIGSTVTGIGVTAWDLFNVGLRYAGTYSSTTTYYSNDVVEYSSSAYVGLGTTSFRNVLPGSDPNSWGALALGDSNALLTTKGDMLIRDASAPARLGISTISYKALGVSTTGVPQWMTIGDATRIYHVDPELGSDSFNGSTPDMAFRTLKYACDNASAITGITSFRYDRISGVATVTAPSHGILYPNITIRLEDITFECLSGGRTYVVNGFIYDKTSGIGTVNVGAGATGITPGTVIRLKDLEFTCPGGSGITTTFFPDGTRAQGNNFTVTAVNSATSFAINVGVSTITHLYVQGGNAFVGFDTTVFPRNTRTSYFTVSSIIDNNTFTTNVGVSTIDHAYVSGGRLYNLSPAVVKLSASEFVEQLPITVPAFTSVVGSTLRASKIRPAAGLSTDGLTPNNRQTMFRLSDATTIQGLNVSGLVGFNYNVDRPYELDATTIRTGIGTTACGVYFAFNPVSPILNKSPYVKDCTSFSDPATDGTGHGGGVGVFVDGGVHNSGAKTMVFDAYTNVNSDGAGFILDKDAGAEIVSCFTYYCKWGYYSGGGSRIRGVSGNNSYGDYGVIAAGFSTSEVPRTVRVFGDKVATVVGTKTGTVAIGNTMIGETSGARATFTNDQTSADKIYFKYWPGYGAAGVGTTAFKDGEQITFIGAGTTGAITVSAITGSVSGQKGIIIEVDEVDPLNLPKVGDSIGFSTSGIGSDRVDGAIRYYIINNVSGYGVTFTQNRGYLTGAPLTPVVYNNKMTLTISPEKTIATPDTRSTYLAGVGTASGGSFAEIRTKFSNARLTGHDFLSVGTGNKVETNYPNVNEANVQQGNEVSTFGPGKVFFVSTDQGGNFRVGEYFSVDQLTGRATLDASAFNLSGLTELRLGSLGGQIGEAINEFSSDETMSGNSNQATPTEFAVVGYITRGKMGTGAMVPSKGTTAQRPAGGDIIEGQFRYNSDLKTPEYYDGTQWIPSGRWTTVDVSTTTTAVSWRTYFCNTSGGGFTLTLPASPVKGDTIRIFDTHNTFDTNTLTIGRNGKPIGGTAADMTVTSEGAAFELVFFDNTQGWRIFTV